MNESVLAGQVERLARSVRRWRLATFILGVLLLCSLAIGGTFVTMLIVRLPERPDIQQVLLHEQQARRQAEQAQREAEVARRRLEQELEAARKHAP